MKSPRTVRELFSMPGFVANATLDGVFGDSHARIITLLRRKKRPSVPTVVIAVATITTNVFVERAISPWPTGGFIWNSSVGASTVRGAVVCM